MVVGFSRKDFLEALFGQYFRKRDGFLIVKTVRNRDYKTSTRFFPNIEILSRESYDESQNVFFGICPRESMKADGEDAVRYITSLWAGLDLGPDGHSGRRSYFSDNRQVARAVRSFPLNPSIIVESGTGMHLYWLLKSVTEIQDPEFVEEQLGKINHYFQCRTEVKLNSTMRLPGTVNSKMTGQALRCSVKFINPDFRYELTDFEKLKLLDPGAPIRSVKTASAKVDAHFDQATPNVRSVNEQTADPSEQLVSYFSENHFATNDIQPGTAPTPGKGVSATLRNSTLSHQSIEPLPYEPEAAAAEPIPQPLSQQPSDILVDGIVEKVVAKIADRLSDELVDQIVEKLAQKLRKKI
jgi:hypothetical protein